MSYFNSKQAHDTDEDWLKAQQISEAVSTQKASLIANAVNFAILMFVFRSTITLTQFLCSFAAMAILLLWRHSLSWRYWKAVDAGHDFLPLERDINLNALCFGICWGTLIGLLMPIASPGQQMALAAIGTGTLNAATITYRTLSNAARLYVASAGIGFMLGLMVLGTTEGYSVVGLLLCFTITLAVIAKANTERFRANKKIEHKASESAETIQLLLNDYEEQGSDWLFQLDEDGHISRPSQRFGAAAQRPVETLAGIRFVDLFSDSPEKDELEECLLEKRPVRGLTLSLELGGETHWWLINVRPSEKALALWRGVISDITSQQRAEEQVSYMARYDALTSLPNRFRFNEDIASALRGRKREVGLMCLDLDKFKDVNDTLGHPVGDELLVAVARRLEQCVRTDDVVSRLGGDEFAILVASRNIKHIDTIAERINDALSRPFSLKNHDVVIGVSIGIAIAPHHGEDAAKLMQSADLALYAAKSQGRSCAARFDPTMDDAAQERRILEMDLRRALAADELRIFYQPQINVDTGETIGFEALMRWEHPERGIVMPNAFIPIAEDTGLIVQLGEWIIRQTLSDAAQWDEHLSVAVNLSPSQMRSPTLVSTIINALAQTGVAAHRLEMEITESVLLENSQANLDTLHRLRDLGVRIALDDFGTGYSSLNYLRSFPFDKIKIDRCFVEDIDTREDCQAIVRSVVSLANSLGMITTAEGVERHDQMEELRRDGCTQVQGFLFSKAVPMSELSNLRTPKSQLTGVAVPFARPAAQTVSLKDKRRAAG